MTLTNKLAYLRSIHAFNQSGSVPAVQFVSYFRNDRMTFPGDYRNGGHPSLHSCQLLIESAIKIPMTTRIISPSAYFRYLKEPAGILVLRNFLKMWMMPVSCQHKHCMIDFLYSLVKYCQSPIRICVKFNSLVKNPI